MYTLYTFLEIIKILQQPKCALFLIMVTDSSNKYEKDCNVLSLKQYQLCQFNFDVSTV